VFVVFEGGEGAGKSTQAQLLVDWLRQQGREVVLTREPGGTGLGRRLRDLLLDVATGSVTPRAEALLYAADRAEHVSAVVRPALARGRVVVSDRYLDSSIAYQGAGRFLSAQEVAELNAWATEGLVPDLTVLLDVDPDVGLHRFAAPADRMESEPREFHRRARAGFLALAEAAPERYVVIDATRPAEDVHGDVQVRVAELMQ
jgi:dTMP kinase